MRRMEMACAVALVLLTLSLHARQAREAGQPTGDGRWRAWLGCWIPVQRAQPDQDVSVCVVPTADQAGVRMITFADDQRILDEPVVADGSLRRLTPGQHEPCEGGTRSRWSADGERVFTNAEVHCPGNAPQLTSGLSTIMRDGRWLDIQVAQGAGGNRVRVKQYVRAAGDPPVSLVDEGFRAPASVPIQSVRVTADDVVEAYRAVGARTVEAWLAEADVAVPLDKRTLVRLADADVPEPVIDLLVALAYPEHFEVRRQGSSFGGFFDSSAAGVDDAFDLYALYYSPFGPFYFTDWSPLDWWSSGDVTLPPEGGGGSTGQSAHGRVVNGSGYTQVQPREPAHSVPRSGSDTAASASGGDGSGSSSSGGSSGSGGSSASPAGYSGGGGGSGGTAVPR